MNKRMKMHQLPLDIRVLSIWIKCKLIVESNNTTKGLIFFYSLHFNVQK